jgi:hypothetical protein
LDIGFLCCFNLRGRRGHDRMVVRFTTIYIFVCNECLSPLMLWVRISIRARCTTLCDKGCRWLATVWWFSPDPPVSSTNKTDCHDIIEILLKVASNTMKTNKIFNLISWCDLSLRTMVKSWSFYTVLQVTCISFIFRTENFIFIWIW